MGRHVEPQKHVGNAVRRFRVQRRFTQRELALRANVDATWLSHLELGRSNPAWGTLARIAEALDITMVELAASIERFEKGLEKADYKSRVR